jgi:hypothetical protein
LPRRCESTIGLAANHDPWLAYGEPLDAYPGWVGGAGVYGPDPYFGAGVDVAFGLGWAWGDWGFDWRDRRVTYNHAPYTSHSRTFDHRHDFDPGGEPSDHRGAHFGPGPVQLGLGAAPFDHTAGRTGVHSGAFSGFDHGGVTRGYASRGQSSFGGGFNAGGLGATSANAGGFSGEGMHAGGFNAAGMHAGGFLGGGGFHGGGGGGGHR